MGVPSLDEFDRTRNWLHQKVPGVRRARYLGHARCLRVGGARYGGPLYPPTTVLTHFVDLPHARARMHVHVHVHVHVPRCWARSSSGCASCCATARDAPRCAPTIHPPTTSRTTRTASRYASTPWCTCTHVCAHMHSSHALCRLRSTGTSRRRSILKRTGPPPRPARARSTCPSSRKSSTSSRSSSERSTSSRRRIAAGVAQNSATPDSL